MKKTITNIALIGLGSLILFYGFPIGGILIGIGSTRLLFQIIDRALEG